MKKHAGKRIFTMMTGEFIFRLVIAGILGALVGLDREYRAKEAGTRTHFLVSLGSALIMMVSQWGFEDILKVQGVGLDPSRVAAQVVSGIGFIGAGTIMMQKQFVRGLTTAAGLWVVAGIGLAVGGGLYTLGIAATLLTLIGLEVLRFFLRNFKTKCTFIVFLTKNRDNLIRITNELNANDYHIISFSVGGDVTSGGEEMLRVKMYIRERESRDENHLLRFMQQFDDIVIEKME